VTKLSGKRPTGYVAPWWEFSTVTSELLLERGIKYDHSLMHQPYYVRVRDSWTKIDYSKQPSEWMVPLMRGRETDLIEIPASWYLVDLPLIRCNLSPPPSDGTGDYVGSRPHFRAMCAVCIVAPAGRTRLSADGVVRDSGRLRTGPRTVTWSTHQHCGDMIRRWSKQDSNLRSP
jgi:hypothetical protein